jgi:hypothetical protein
MVVGSLIAASSFFYFSTFSGRLCSMIASIYFATQVAYRLGVYYGFARGFRQGREKVVPALGDSSQNGSTADASSVA